jgi:DNA-binding CsgD family transcriptional regulator/pimeloyl-ACP methyl ester carboxylesterase
MSPPGDRRRADRSSRRLRDLTHIEFAWRDPGLARFLGRLADWARVIYCDKRGFGLSDPIDGTESIDERIVEFTAVLDAVGSDRTALSGSGKGVRWQWRLPPPIPSAPIPWCSTGSGARNSAARRLPARVSARDPRVGTTEKRSRTGAIRKRSISPCSRRAVPTTWNSESTSPSSNGWVRVREKYLEAALWALDIDVRDSLPTITVPTLMLHRTDDMFCLSRTVDICSSTSRTHSSSSSRQRPLALRGRQRRDHRRDRVVRDRSHHPASTRCDVVPVGLRQHGVTRREFEVLDLVASGATNAEIAETLHISVRTVESHISSMFAKLGSANRASLIATGISTRMQLARTVRTCT